MSDIGKAYFHCFCVLVTLIVVRARMDDDGKAFDRWATVWVAFHLTVLFLQIFAIGEAPLFGRSPREWADWMTEPAQVSAVSIFLLMCAVIGVRRQERSTKEGM